jgi:hypothetical protein
LTITPTPDAAAASVTPDVTSRFAARIGSAATFILRRKYAQTTAPRAAAARAVPNRVSSTLAGCE